MARTLLAQEPGRVESHTNAAHIQTLAQPKAARHKRGIQYWVTPAIGEPFTISVKGRVKWALDLLCARGAKGIATVENPAPRLAAYVHSLRELGVEIETITEPHDGDYPGYHARYVLRSGVTLIRSGGAA